MLKTFSGRNPSQNEFELRGFIDLLRASRVTKYLEIGARHGDTFHEVMLRLPAGSRGVAVDLPGALWGKSDTGAALERAAADLRQRGYEIDVILGDSTCDIVRNAVAGFGPYDAALIDGDHTYDGVRADWEAYGDCAPLVAFHDIVGAGQAEKVHGNPVEVPRFWDEIKNADSVEFVDEGSKMGIGVMACK